MSHPRDPFRERVDERNLHEVMARLLADLPRAPPPARDDARGLVICGGGLGYFPGAYVAIRRLRDVGCALPIELWHLGPAELDARMEALVSPYGVRCVDADAHPMAARVGPLTGWACKPFALLHTRFRHVLLLDADNVPLRDPAALFESAAYADHGALFWRDIELLDADRPLWHLFGLPGTEVAAWESGQIFVDRVRHEAPLWLALWQCVHGDFFWRYFNGDKEAFHLAFRKLAAAHYLVPYPPQQLEYTFGQRDLEGARLFQHRVNDAWYLEGSAALEDGFADLDACLAHLDALRDAWAPWYDGVRPGASERLGAAAEELTRGEWRLSVRDEGAPEEAADLRVLTLQSSGRVGQGRGEGLAYFDLREESDEVALVLLSRFRQLATLRRGPDGVWRGRGGRRRPLAYALEPLTTPSAAVPELAPSTGALEGRRFTWQQGEGPPRPMTLVAGGHVGEGAGPDEAYWRFTRDERDAHPALELWSHGFLTARLRPAPADAWVGRRLVGEEEHVTLRPRREDERPQLLFVTPIAPDPRGVGLAQRAAMLVAAAWRRYDVHLCVVPLAGGAEQVPSSVAEACARVTFVPLGEASPQPGWPSASRHATPALCDAIAAAFAGTPFVAVHVQRLYAAPFAAAWLASPDPARPRLSLDLDELDSAAHERLARLLEGDGRTPAAAAARAEASAFAALERALLPRFDRVFVASELEAERARSLAPESRVRVVQNAVRLPAVRVGAARSAEVPATLLFVGNLSYAPNEDAAARLCTSILAAARARLRERGARVLLCGARPSERVRGLATLPDVELVADAPALAPHYAAADVAVVPLRSGGGTRLKILEAFAHGVPVVTTALGAEGLARPEDDGRLLLLAESDDEIADACARLCRDPALAARIAGAAYAHVCERHDLDRIIPDAAGALP